MPLGARVRRDSEPGLSRIVPLVNAFWGTPSPRWRLCGPHHINPTECSRLIIERKLLFVKPFIAHMDIFS